MKLFYFSFISDSVAGFKVGQRRTGNLETKSFLMTQKILLLQSCKLLANSNVAGKIKSNVLNK